MLLSFVFAKTSWELSVIFYLAAFVGDVVDGYVARAFNQCKCMYFNVFRCSDSLFLS